MVLGSSLDIQEQRHDISGRGLEPSEEDWCVTGFIFLLVNGRQWGVIAEGNPDEEKIGAFGVGFYSLFSVAEEPFVQSGEEYMWFYWKDKKDQVGYSAVRFLRSHLTPRL